MTQKVKFLCVKYMSLRQIHLEEADKPLGASIMLLLSECIHFHKYKLKVCNSKKLDSHFRSLV